MSSTKGPVLIELDDATVVEPENAPAVPDVMDAPTGQAMQTAAAFAARPPSPLLRWFWRLGGAVLSFGLSVWAWDTINALIARNPYLGLTAAVLVGAFLLVCIGMILREWTAYARLKRLDKVHAAAASALADNDLAAAHRVVDQIAGLYRGRQELAWGRERLAERRREIMDADGVLELAEAELLIPLDALAKKEIEAAARNVATVTAIVPLALADVVTALTANLRMVRRIAEIYGGRAGTFGSWRLMRTVFTHLVATGAVAVGDDLIGSVAGGGVLSKFSRRFGEGVINGSLTARVGVAALEVCRPLPFRVAKRPSVTGLVKRALTGLFGAK
ncbi:MAG: YcjF family protein [Marinosulfonomonas sp.]